MSLGEICYAGVMRTEEPLNSTLSVEGVGEWVEVAPLFVNVRNRHTEILSLLTNLKVKVDSLMQQWASED